MQGVGGGGLASSTIFRKGGLDRTETFRGDFFQGGCNFHIKNKLKSEIFNDRKSLLAKIFSSVKTKDSNWEILPKNLVTFKREDGIKDEKL